MRVSVLSCSRDVEFRTNLSTSTLRHSFHVMPLHSKEGVTIRAFNYPSAPITNKSLDLYKPPINQHEPLLLQLLLRQLQLLQLLPVQPLNIDTRHSFCLSSFCSAPKLTSCLLPY
ncbi:hypothetical protein DTO282F9_3882 [Paecilomyces variotii]|nr:hypothetical protein DTO282E5_4342 [Paecilomyces variotii]KAJ9399259.1 hypothetical protein DTO282F9_3882 [Paecilomyces variotii]